MFFWVCLCEVLSPPWPTHVWCAASLEGWNRRSDIMIAAVLWTLALVKFAYGSGNFEIQINKFQNVRGELANGSCCDGVSNGLGTCTNQCETFVRLCLKEYQTRVTTGGSCTFGNISSRILGGNSFTYPEDSNSTLILPFDFAWTVSFWPTSSFLITTWFCLFLD
jgi:jagged-like protein